MLVFLFAVFSDEPEVFLPKYSQTAILHAAHFWRVVNDAILTPHSGVTVSVRHVGFGNSVCLD